jgi:hypothetical protein
MTRSERGFLRTKRRAGTFAARVQGRALKRIAFRNRSWAITEAVDVSSGTTTRCLVARASSDGSCAVSGTWRRRRRTRAPVRCWGPFRRGVERSAASPTEAPLRSRGNRGNGRHGRLGQRLNAGCCIRCLWRKRFAKRRASGSCLTGDACGSRRDGRSVPPDKANPNVTNPAASRGRPYRGRP